MKNQSVDPLYFLNIPSVQGTYGIAPGEGKKMYNHSCDLMDHGVQGNYEAGGQELDPRRYSVWYKG